MPNVTRLKKSEHQKHTIFIFDGEKYEVLSHISGDEKRAINLALPHLSPECFTPVETEDGEETYQVSLGRGASSRVNIARKKTSTGHFKYYAIKRLITDNNLNKHRLAVQSTLRELKLHEKMAKIGIPHILPVIHYGVTTNTKQLKQVYQIMPIASYGTGKQLLAQLVHLPSEANRTELFDQLASQLFNTLTKLHQHKIFHLDIKPENIFLMDESTLQLGDFGSALYYSDDERAPIIETSGRSDSAYHLPHLHYTRLLHLSALVASNGAASSGITNKSLTSSNEDQPKKDKSACKLKRLHALKDAWAAMLTLLPLWHVNAQYALEDILNNCDAFKKRFSKLESNEVRAFYQTKFDALFAEEHMKNMPKKWKNIFQEIINIALELLTPSKNMSVNQFSLHDLIKRHYPKKFYASNDTYSSIHTLFQQMSPERIAQNNYLSALIKAKEEVLKIELPVIHPTDQALADPKLEITLASIKAKEEELKVRLSALVKVIDQALANPDEKITLSEELLALAQHFPNSPYHTHSPAKLIIAIDALLKNKTDPQAIEGIKAFSATHTPPSADNYSYLSP